MVIFSSSFNSQLPSSQLSKILRRQRQAMQMRNLLTVSSVAITLITALLRWLSSLALLSLSISFLGDAGCASVGKIYRWR